MVHNKEEIRKKERKKERKKGVKLEIKKKERKKERKVGGELEGGMVGKGGGGGRVMGVFASNSKICNLFLNTDIYKINEECCPIPLKK